MAQEPSSGTQTNLYRLAAAIEYLTEKTKEQTEGAKSRDAKLEQIVELFRSQAEQVRDLARSARDQQENTAKQLSDAKHEQRNHAQIINSRVELLDHHVKSIDTKMDFMKDEVDALRTQSTSLQQEVTNLKEPVEQLLALRRNVYAFVALFSSLFATLWIIGQPILSWITTHFLSVWFPDGKH